jgi:hypothetical protein
MAIIVYLILLLLQSALKLSGRNEKKATPGCG